MIRLSAILRACALSAGFAVWAGTASALDLSLPGEADLTREIVETEGTYFLPTGPFANGTLPTKELEGLIIRQAWRIEGASRSTLSVVNLVRAQLEGQGYRFLLDCTASECGEFDFRFATEVLPGPDMFVDIFDYRFLSVQNPDAVEAEYVSALVSQAGGVIYLQLVAVGQDQVDPLLVTSDEAAENAQSQRPENPTDLLVREGHVVLMDLEFATGATTLTDRSYPSLQALADFLNADPARRVALVGHTDTVGALEDNIALSKQRAQAVLTRLVDVLGVSPQQLQADGVGYLAPQATNITETGRETNRRVEAILLDGP